MGILMLNWIEMVSNRRKATRLLKGLFLPLWILVSLLVNMLALLIDWLDRTKSFYNNILVVLKKPL
ncbi:MAG: hypothetical protein DRJ64_04175 [Thermoprotei archaeon]|nr:MAG: hypothetical protein DRJ64_04175 [Thermoprotei archaeon]